MDVGLVINYTKCAVMDSITKKSLVLPLSIVHALVIDCLSKVSSLKLLSVIFSSDLSWNEHISYVISKCYKRIFIVRNLKQADCSHKIIFRCYVTFIRAVMTYGFPTFCNLPMYLFKKLLRIERVASRFFSSYEFPQLSSAVDSMCHNLFHNIVNCESHPLRLMFDSRVVTPRNFICIRAPHAATTR